MSLLDRVRHHLERKPPLAADAEGAPADLELKAAAAVLLLEAAYGDEEYLWKEGRALVRALEHGFGIDREEALEIVGRAEAIRPPTVRLDDVTHVLCARYDAAQRQQVLALVWKVIDVDGVLAEWEAAFAEHLTGALELTSEQGREARELARRGEA